MKNLLLFKGWTLLCCILLCFISSQSFATRHTDPFDCAQGDKAAETKQQQQTITGTITHNNMPMTGVTITVKGKNTVAVSDENGKFTIAANGTDTLIFEYLGFKTVTIAVNDKTNLAVALEEDVNDLKEVTVNAGYYKVKDSERTGSISKITAKDIEKQPVTNVLAAMQGRMAGVNISQDSGMPGGAFSIRIRGQNSLRADGSEPLYVIDGVPYSSETIGYAQTSTNTPGFTSPLNSINPADIESIAVLKDADATAIYGSRGANGVVLISTKKGKPGKTTFTFSTMHGAGKATRMPKLMNTDQYLQLRRQAFANDGITTYPATAYDINGTWDTGRYTDWQKEILGGAADINQTTAGISGGSELTQFVVNGTYRTEGTVFPGNFVYKKGAVHLNLNHRSEDSKFRMNFSAGYTTQDNDQPWTDLTREARLLPPNAPALYNPDGSLNWENGTWENPLRNLLGKFLSNTQDLSTNTLLSYKILPNLELRSSFGFTDLRHDELRSSPSTMYNPSSGAGPEYSGLYSNKTGRQSWIIEPQLDYSMDIGKGKLGALAGLTFQNQIGNRLYQLGSGFTSNSLIFNLASASSVTVFASDQSVYKYNAVYARINYNWQDRYIVNLTGRRDGSSRFGPGNRFANFGAVGAAWLFSNEGFVKDNLSFLSFGKLRGSYGTSGNDQIGDYQFLDTYSSSGNIYQGVTGLQPTRLFNADFGWETNRKTELALEAGFLNDRITTSVAWFRNRSSSQLVGIPLAATTGFGSLNANLDATVENTGIELTLRTVNFSKGSFNWTTSINLTLPKNRLVSFPGLEYSSYAQTYEIGRPLGIRKLYHFTGIDPQTGIYRFEDFNGDGAITAPDDQQQVADLSPEYYGGLQNSVSYKGFNLDFVFQFTKQQTFAYLMGYAGGMNNKPVAMLDSWMPLGGQGTYQVYTSGANVEATRAATRYGQSDGAIVDGSYIRLKTIALSYDLPQKWIPYVKIRASVQGQNVLTFTHYKGGDPEFRATGFLPPLRTITAGLQFVL